MINERWAWRWSRSLGSQPTGEPSHKPGGRLPYFLSCRPILLSQPKSITTPGPVPNYAAWWQRYTGVNNLPKVAAQQCPSRSRTCYFSMASLTLCRSTTVWIACCDNREQLGHGSSPQTKYSACSFIQFLLFRRPRHSYNPERSSFGIYAQRLVIVFSIFCR